MDLLLLFMLIVQFVAILVICGRTSHVECVSDKLSRIEKLLEQLANQFGTPCSEEVSQQPSLPQLSEEELMEKYGITFENEKYIFKTYRYDKIEDAVSYASQTNQ